MMSKFSKVTREGKYIKPPHSKLSYSSMVVVRVDIVRRSFPILAKATTIAIRYSVVKLFFIFYFFILFILFFTTKARKQGYLKGQDSVVGSQEVSVIEYQTQQKSLFYILSCCFALMSVSRMMERIFNQIKAEMDNGEFDGLADLHSSSCGLKTYSSW